MASSETVLRMFALLNANWPTYRYTDATVELYERCLSDLEDDLVEIATLQCLTNCTYFPNIAEIRRRAIDIKTGAAAQPSALEAWGMVQRHMRLPVSVFRNGESVKTPSLDERTEAAVRAVGGWSYLRMSDSVMADRARFCEVYETLQNRARQDALLLPEVRAVAERLRMERPREVKALTEGKAE